MFVWWGWAWCLCDVLLSCRSRQQGSVAFWVRTDCGCGAPVHAYCRQQQQQSSTSLGIALSSDNPVCQAVVVFNDKTGIV